MMTPSPDPANEESVLSLEWQRWPLKEAGRAGLGRVVVVVLTLLAVSIILLISLPPLAALALTFLVLITVSPYFLPQRYRVSDSGLSVSRGFLTQQRAWAEFKAYQKVETGYLLLTTGDPSTAGFDRTRLRNLYLPSPLDLTVQQRLVDELDQCLTALP